MKIYFRSARAARAISEKLIIHLRCRYVFLVDGRCAFNAFARRRIDARRVGFNSLSLLSRVLPSRAIPLSRADWKPDTQSRLNQ